MTMVAGQIGWYPTQWGPAIRVCDGVKTSAHVFSVVETLHVPFRGPVANGELIAAGHYTSGVFQYNHVLLGYGGAWYRTNEAWIRDTGFYSTYRLELDVIPYTKTGTLALPTLLISSAADPSYCCWCPTGWVQLS